MWRKYKDKQVDSARQGMGMYATGGRKRKGHLWFMAEQTVAGKALQAVRVAM